jgi:NitT/TauT family transport system substrate-binding protein
MKTIESIFAVAVAALVVACGDPRTSASAGLVLRVGHFPNVTHAQALIGHALSNERKGWFEERLGPDAKVEWFAYNAGPDAVQALLAGTLDLAYVGPSPALNAYVKSKGEEIRVIAGAARGGAALVVQGDGRIAKAADFRGKKVATPQLGNTQDVACRAWLAAQGFHVTTAGGDVTVWPTPNDQQLQLFAKGDLDAAWTVEPWVSRLERDAKAKVFLEEKDAVTTVLVAGAKFLRERPDPARRFAAAHGELTKWIVAHPDEARAKVRAEISAETHVAASEDLIARCWPRLVFDSSISLDAFTKFVESAQAAGFLKDAGDLSRFVQAPR